MTTFTTNPSDRDHAYTEAVIYAEGTDLTADDLFVEWVSACMKAGERVSCHRVYEQAIRGHETRISLRDWNNEQPITHLWICGVGCPAGIDYHHNTDTNDDEDYCDFSDLVVLEKLWDLNGTIDEHGRWVWDGRGDVRDLLGNTLYNIKARR